MNTQLNKLLENSNLSEKDKFEINQIFFLLPPDKQQNILNNFEVLCFRLEQMHNESLIEQEILLWNLYEDLEKFVEEERKKSVMGV